MPFISIVIPACNRAHLLPRVLGSLLRQDFKDFEAIVVDDGSSDDTRAVVEGVEDARVRYVHQENAGAGAARNHGARVARAERVAFLDSDDEAAPGWLSALREGFEKHAADVVCCSCKVVGEDGKTKKVRHPRSYGPPQAPVRALFFGAFAMRKAVFEAVGGYAEDLPASQQTDFSIRLVWHPDMERWTIHNVQDLLVIVHHHAGDQIGENRLARYRGGRRIVDMHADKLRADPAALANLCGSVGVNAFRLGKRAEARRLFWMALREDPTDWRRWMRVAMAHVPPVARRVWSA